MEYSFYSTTAKVDSKMQSLPDKNINLKNRKNQLFATSNEIENYFKKKLLKKMDCYFVDIERKRELNLFKEFSKQVGSNILPYKPNDITLEAVDLLILKKVGYNLEGKKIIVFGAGNIGSKLSIRLAERNAQVFLWDINEKKLNEVMTGINHILPKETTKINCYKKEKIYDICVSFLGAEKIIGENFMKNFYENSFIVDGGIGNFTPEFIKCAIEKKIELIRLDVRLGDRILEAHVNNYLNDLPIEIGRNKIEGISYVTGGMYGEKGEIITDTLTNPTKIIGLANGIGGLIPAEQITEIDNERIKIFNEIISNTKKNF